jgi:hypothetical protein
LSPIGNEDSKLSGFRIRWDLAVHIPNIKMPALYRGGCVELLKYDPTHVVTIDTNCKLFNSALTLSCLLAQMLYLTYGVN